MKKLIASFLLLTSFPSFAQSPDGIFSIVRKNYYSTETLPFDTTITIEVLDSSTYRLGKVDPLTGFVENLGNQTFNGGLNLTGSALNPYDNSYIFFGGNQLISLDLTSGNLINSVPVFNPNGASYFDNFRFNNSDSTMYGLARRSFFDTVTMTNTGEIFLSKVNVQTGEITEISQNSFAPGFALAGSAIDPYEMVYYFSVGSNLIGVDIYNGNVYNNLPIINPNGIAFDNFAYNCVDSTLYGLVRNNYFSLVYDSLINNYIQVLDSATAKLGKIDLTTGLVSLVSPSGVVFGGYTLNGGATIDPLTGVYYFSTGNEVVGVSTQTGMLVSNPTKTYEDGQYADLMRQYQSCIDVKPKRLNTSLNVTENSSLEVGIYPNPSSDKVRIEAKTVIDEIQVYSTIGQLLFTETATNEFSVESLIPGNYYVRIYTNGTVTTQQLIKK
jgi:hypothetical protein